VFHIREATTGKAPLPMVKDRCVRQKAMTMKWNRDDDGPRQQMTGGIPQRDTVELSGVGIFMPKQPA